VLFYTECAVPVLISAVLTAHLSVGANSAPPGLLAGFWGGEEKGKRDRKETGRGNKGKGRGGKRKGQRKGEGKTRERKGKAGASCQITLTTCYYAPPWGALSDTAIHPSVRLSFPRRSCRRL